jgi:hypothetical protein
MRAKSADPDHGKTHAVPAELVNMLGTAGALLGVVATGAAISSVLPDPSSPWLFAAAYGGPGAIAFGAYWWVAQRL